MDVRLRWVEASFVKDLRVGSGADVRGEGVKECGMMNFGTCL